MLPAGAVAGIMAPAGAVANAPSSEAGSSTDESPLPRWVLGDTSDQLTKHYPDNAIQSRLSALMQQVRCHHTDQHSAPASHLLCVLVQPEALCSAPNLDLATLRR